MEPIFLIVDLFCGAGGTSTGFENNPYCKVIACVNHDANAIKSHAANHPETVHFTEDIRTMDLHSLFVVVNKFRTKYPNAFLILWASLECTNFSKAKGGQPRNADSRTLAESLYMHYTPETNTYYIDDSYVQVLQPDYIMIENVVEFMSWGPLDDAGKPVSRKNGTDFLRWRKEIDQLGYRNEWLELNSANFGAYTSRNRLFGIFAKDGLPIVWPHATHSKKASNSLYGESLKKWMPVKDVLDFSDEGISIFGRKKQLSDKTFERIYAGLIKFVAGGKNEFLVKYNSLKNGRCSAPDLEDPLAVIPTRNTHYLAFIRKYYSSHPERKCISAEDPLGTIDSQSPCRADFLIQRNTGNPESKIMSIENPARTITGTGGNQELINAHFLNTYHGNGDNIHDINSPAPTVPCKDSIASVKACFLDKQYSGAANNQSVNQPAGAIMGNDKHSLITSNFLVNSFTGGGQINNIDGPAPAVTTVPKSNVVSCESFVMSTNFDNKPSSINEPCSTITANRKWHYIVNPSHGGNPSSVDEPSPVIIARQDKAPLYLVINEGGEMNIRIDPTDTEIIVKIKEFMCLYSIVDIKMRMLKIPELLKIQGFPEKYTLIGTQAEQKKYIGNAVHPLVPDAIAKAFVEKFKELTYKIA